ncbi:hypothetical protein [Paenibacillus elgii]|uniref:Uncharacterized protein n=1 Tax=Paenibacillus elgii TaxID=189691 RepID=A0A161S012_9BACL|nr:hypothetical protein [Paenibacillus elgii]KZE76694.1 hypothetical protein AV654_02840 [Paenibacillus elgii]NEN82767.1 hypothetical protein [Paenibacillus elgii]
MDELLRSQLGTESITTDMVKHCSYCVMISPDPLHRTPVYCIKYSGSNTPILVNLATCLTCGDFKKCGLGFEQP